MSQSRSAPACPECDGLLCVEHTETVCGSCGLVVDEDPLDRGPEWRGIDDEREGTGAPLTRSRHDRGLTTEIGRGGGARDRAHAPSARPAVPPAKPGAHRLEGRPQLGLRPPRDPAPRRPVLAARGHPRRRVHTLRARPGRGPASRALARGLHRHLPLSASAERGYPLTQKHAASVADVMPVTLRSTYTKLLDEDLTRRDPDPPGGELAA